LIVTVAALEHDVPPAVNVQARGVAATVVAFAPLARLIDGVPVTPASVLTLKLLAVQVTGQRSACVTDVVFTLPDVITFE